MGMAALRQAEGAGARPPARPGAANDNGPLSGAADTVRYVYDGAGRAVGVIGPDPDGGGALLHRAARVTYDAAGRVTWTEQGTTAGQSDAQWAAFSALAKRQTVYNTYGQAAQSRVYSGATSTVLALTQRTYDAAGRPICTLVRMNPAVFGSVGPSCTLGTAGTFGDDRIDRNYYTAAGQLNYVRHARGTALQQNDARFNYWPNGRPLYLRNALEYRTTYTYDGHDRLAQVRYPDRRRPTPA